MPNSNQDKVAPELLHLKNQFEVVVKAPGYNWEAVSSSPTIGIKSAR